MRTLSEEDIKKRRARTPDGKKPKSFEKKENPDEAKILREIAESARQAALQAQSSVDKIESMIASILEKVSSLKPVQVDVNQPEQKDKDVIFEVIEHDSQGRIKKVKRVSQ